MFDVNQMRKYVLFGEGNHATTDRAGRCGLSHHAVKSHSTYVDLPAWYTDKDVLLYYSTYVQKSTVVQVKR